MFNPMEVIGRAKQRRQRAALAGTLADQARIRAGELRLQSEHCREPGVAPSAEDNLVISLTTIGSRLDNVALTIESLMQQTQRASRIVLCLDRETFRWRELPLSLSRQQGRGLEILFCERDLGPHTKYYYTLQKYPDSLLLTVDDDKLYPDDMVARLLVAHRAQPGVVHCHRGHGMTFRRGQIRPYKRWQWNTLRSEASPLVFPTGVGGVLYFPGCFDEHVLDDGLFRQLCPSADDVWLKAMTLARGVDCQVVPRDYLWKTRNLTIPGSQQTALKRRNKHAVSGNDAQIARTFDYFGLLAPLAHEYRARPALKPAAERSGVTPLTGTYQAIP
ncbi:glycosyltransferase family 2 protein [Parahaliea maris]|uniref:Glycosyltransferase family 2 protein n=1 Tax=Parahaliea maris TaxID=2716870 RepID=A0A5C9AAN3_9GAMM|nr:glycosyltransferase family A protein [Parahaliea maris]TXS96710.1 glycosyltransferase family 2 protein [Parahaliea maris]